MATPTWNDLQRSDQQQPARPSPSALRHDELCALVFSAGHGRELIDLLRARHVERRLPPGAPDAILREVEAVRGFILDLERARDRGLETIKNAKAKPA